MFAPFVLANFLALIKFVLKSQSVENPLSPNFAVPIFFAPSGTEFCKSKNATLSSIVSGFNCSLKFDFIGSKSNEI